MTSIETSTAPKVALTPIEPPAENPELGRELLLLKAESQTPRDEEREAELAGIRERAKFD